VPVPSSRDAAQTEAQLAEWLARDVTGGEPATVSLLEGPRSSGFSSETLLFDAAWPRLAPRHRLALAARVKPTGYTLYQEHALDEQWRVMDALSRNTTIPVPAIVGDDTTAASPLGQPFFVMERVEGVVPADAPPYTVRGWLAESTEAQQARVYERGLETLVAIHAVDWEALDLAFLENSTSNPVGVAAQMDHDDGFLAWVAAGRRLGEFETAAKWLRSNLPADDEVVLNWGDARLGNMLFRDYEPVAVLDWEMATLGAPAADLGWWLVFCRLHTDGIGRPDLPGFPTEDQTVARYEALSGRTVRDLHFYEVRAAFRCGLLLRRFTDMLVETGALQPDARNPPHKPAVTVLSTLLAT
jgi:aminoglycoside phosphotransferase (APT) family kinase protein